MNKISVMLRSSLGRKLMMSLTGLFLILFLVVHLVGNLQLLAGDGGVAFNRYSHFMSNSLLIQTVSKLNFTFILLHVLYSIWLTRTLSCKASGICRKSCTGAIGMEFEKYGHFGHARAGIFNCSP